MRVHTFRARQILRTDLSSAWSFFSDPHNLKKITPPTLGFHVCSELPPQIYPGLMIEYRVRPLFGIAVTWLTEIQTS
jgi:ligand-binding SRPBCC domain-containing protein